jgi:DNA gyrase subunit A
LTGLERDKLREELNQLLVDIEGYRKILGDAKVLDNVIRGELTDIASRFGDDRRTEILDNFEESTAEELIPESDIVVVLSKDGFLKRQDLESYTLQGRGGKGRKGAFVREEDAIANVSVTHTHRELYFFTTRGRVLTLRGHMIPETKTGKGKQIAKLLPFEQGEQVVTLYGGELDGVSYVFFITKGGVSKRVEISELADSNRPRRVITLDPGDEIAQVRLTTGKDDLLLMTAGAKALRVKEEEFRSMGRGARGVKGMNLAPGDVIISCDVVSDNTSAEATLFEEAVRDQSHIFILSERGVGKRSKFDDFTPHHRGTSGVRAMNLGPKTGKLIGCWTVREHDEIIAITTRGRMIRVAVSETPILSRTAMGNITVRLDEGDLVADCSIVRMDEPAEGQAPEAAVEKKE